MSDLVDDFISDARERGFSKDLCDRVVAELTHLYLDRGELTFRRRQFLEMDDQLAKLRVERDEMREALEMVSDHIDINYGAHPDIPAYAKAAAVLAKYPVTSPNGDYCVCEEFGISNYSIRCVNCGKPHAPRR
jgi:hypothetical protein